MNRGGNSWIDPDYLNLSSSKWSILESWYILAVTYRVQKLELVPHIFPICVSQVNYCSPTKCSHLEISCNLLSLLATSTSHCQLVVMAVLLFNIILTFQPGKRFISGWSAWMSALPRYLAYRSNFISSYHFFVTLCVTVLILSMKARHVVNSSKQSVLLSRSYENGNGIHSRNILAIE